MDINRALDSVLTSFHSGRLKQAKELCKKILKKRPDSAQAWHFLGVIYHKLGNHDTAIKHIKRSLQFNPTYADAYYNLGNIYQDTKQIDLAISCYKKALQFNPHSAMTHYNLGISLQHQGQLDQAIACYQKALQLNLQTFGLYNNLGVALQAKGNFEEAVAYYERALQLNPNFPEAFNNLGLIAQMKGHFDNAIAYYQKAIELKQDFADAYCNIGMVLRGKGLFDEAISYFQKAIELNKDFTWAYTILGIVLDNKGNIDEAKRYFQKSFQLIPRTSNHYSHVTESLQNKEMRDNITNSIATQDTMSMLIAVCTYNRKKITHLSLAQTQRYKTSSCYVQVYNDHSTEYDNAFLADYADEVIQLPHKMGISDLRWYQFRMFLETDFDLLYMTDNDVIHDPHYIPMLKRLYEMGEGNLPVTIYNSVYTMRPHMIVSYADGLIVKTTVPGNSMLYDRAMVKKIIDVSDKSGHTLDYLPWDNRAVVCLGLPWISTETSYLEHYGAQGINNDNFDRDRAIFPTQYLRERREPILKYLVNDSPLDITF